MTVRVSSAGLSPVISWALPRAAAAWAAKSQAMLSASRSMSSRREEYRLSLTQRTGTVPLPHYHL
jgi:hypothetical protein